MQNYVHKNICNFTNKSIGIIKIKESNGMKKSKSTALYSAEHIKYLKKVRTKKNVITTLRWSILLIFIGLWELLAYLKVIDVFIMSCPSRIVTTIIDLAKSGGLFGHIGVTLYETIVSFILATVLGTGIAICLWWSETLRKTLEPHIVVLNALPKIALGPIIIIWVGAGAGAIIVMALLISLIITIISINNGFMETDKNKILLLKTMGASKFQILTKLVLPNNIPTIISSLKINVGLCWVGTIMGEYLVSKSGLGFLIVYGGQVFQLDLVMASTVILCVLAAAMYFVVQLLEKLVLKRMG